MPVSNVTDGDLLSEAWGDSVANSVNNLEAADVAHVAAADPHPGYRLESAAIGTTDLANDSVSYAKLQNVSATSRVLGRKTAGAGDPEELTAADVAAMLPAVDVQVFSANGTWTKPTGARIVRVRAIGGGGGGGGTQATAAGTQAAASGGGGGGYVEKTYAATALSATEAVTVGGAGSAGGAGANNGGTGGNSTFKGLTASGGGPGEGATASSSGPQHAGANGGAASGGDLNVPGGDGSTSKLNVGVVVAFGDGGASALGTRSGASLDAAGSTGHAYGGGGSGASSGFSAGARAGGAGASGVVIVESYP